MMQCEKVRSYLSAFSVHMSNACFHVIVPAFGLTE